MILTEKQQNYLHYQQVLLISQKILQLKKTLPSDLNRMIKQAKFTYTPLGKPIEKQTKTTENQCEKQIKTIEENGKQLAETNSVVKKDGFDT